MADVNTILLFLGFVIIFGVFGGEFYRRTGIPEILVLLAVGFLAGPVLGILDPATMQAFGPFFAPIALMILLFDSGLGMRIFEVLKRTPRALLLGVVGTFFGIITGAVVMSVGLGWTLLEGALLGAIAGGTSSGVIIPIMSKLKDKVVGETLLLESIFNDAFTIVSAIVIIQIITTPGATLSNAPAAIAASLSVGVVVGLIAGLVWARFFPRGGPEAFSYHMLSLAVLFLMYAATESLGGSGAISALAFGLALGNSGEIFTMLRFRKPRVAKSQLMAYQSEISFLLKTFFFVFLGSIAVLSDVKLIAVGLFLMLVLFMSRFAAVKVSMFGSPLARHVDILTIVTGKGFSAAVLSQLPLIYGVAHGREYADLALIIIVASIVMTSVGLFYWQKQLPPEKPKPSKALKVEEQLAEQA